MLLANCTHQKWQERRLAQKWTKANLSKAETYARELEMAQLLTKEVRSTGEGRVNAVRLETKCGNCGVHHEPGFCKAKGKICFKCQRIGHFRKLCSPSRGLDSSLLEPFRIAIIILFLGILVLCLFQKRVFLVSLGLVLLIPEYL